MGLEYWTAGSGNKYGYDASVLGDKITRKDFETKPELRSSMLRAASYILRMEKDRPAMNGLEGEELKNYAVKYFGGGKAGEDKLIEWSIGYTRSNEMQFVGIDGDDFRVGSGFFRGSLITAGRLKNATTAERDSFRYVQDVYQNGFQDGIINQGIAMVTDVTNLVSVGAGALGNSGGKVLTRTAGQAIKTTGTLSRTDHILNGGWRALEGVGKLASSSHTVGGAMAGGLTEGLVIGFADASARQSISNTLGRGETVNYAAIMGGNAAFGVVLGGAGGALGGLVSKKPTAAAAGAVPTPPTAGKSLGGIPEGSILREAPKGPHKNQGIQSSGYWGSSETTTVAQDITEMVLKGPKNFFNSVYDPKMTDFDSFTRLKIKAMKAFYDPYIKFQENLFFMPSRARRFEQMRLMDLDSYKYIDPVIDSVDAKIQSHLKPIFTPGTAGAKGGLDDLDAAKKISERMQEIAHEIKQGKAPATFAAELDDILKVKVPALKTSMAARSSALDAELDPIWNAIGDVDVYGKKAAPNGGAIVIDTKGAASELNLKRARLQGLQEYVESVKLTGSNAISALDTFSNDATTLLARGTGNSDYVADSLAKFAQDFGARIDTTAAKGKQSVDDAIMRQTGRLAENGAPARLEDLRKLRRSLESIYINPHLRELPVQRPAGVHENSENFFIKIAEYGNSNAFKDGQYISVSSRTETYEKELAGHVAKLYRMNNDQDALKALQYLRYHEAGKSRDFVPQNLAQVVEDTLAGDFKAAGLDITKDEHFKAWKEKIIEIQSSTQHSPRSDGPRESQAWVINQYKKYEYGRMYPGLVVDVNKKGTHLLDENGRKLFTDKAGRKFFEVDKDNRFYVDDPTVAVSADEFKKSKPVYASDASYMAVPYKYDYQEIPIHKLKQEFWAHMTGRKTVSIEDYNKAHPNKPHTAKLGTEATTERMIQPARFGGFWWEKPPEGANAFQKGLNIFTGAPANVKAVWNWATLPAYPGWWLTKKFYTSDAMPIKIARNTMYVAGGAGAVGIAGEAAVENFTSEEDKKGSLNWLFTDKGKMAVPFTNANLDLGVRAVNAAVRVNDWTFIPVKLSAAAWTGLANTVIPGDIGVKAGQVASFSLADPVIDFNNRYLSDGAREDIEAEDKMVADAKAEAAKTAAAKTTPEKAADAEAAAVAPAAPTDKQPPAGTILVGPDGKPVATSLPPVATPPAAEEAAPAQGGDATTKQGAKPPAAAAPQGGGAETPAAPAPQGGGQPLSQLNRTTGTGGDQRGLGEIASEIGNDTMNALQLDADDGLGRTVNNMFQFGGKAVGRLGGFLTNSFNSAMKNKNGRGLIREVGAGIGSIILMSSVISPMLDRMGIGKIPFIGSILKLGALVLTFMAARKGINMMMGDTPAPEYSSNGYVQSVSQAASNVPEAVKTATGYTVIDGKNIVRQHQIFEDIDDQDARVDKVFMTTLKGDDGVERDVIQVVADNGKTYASNTVTNSVIATGNIHVPSNMMDPVARTGMFDKMKVDALAHGDPGGDAFTLTIENKNFVFRSQTPGAGLKELSGDASPSPEMQ